MPGQAVVEGDAVRRALIPDDHPLCFSLAACPLAPPARDKSEVLIGQAAFPELDELDQLHEQVILAREGRDRPSQEERGDHHGNQGNPFHVFVFLYLRLMFRNLLALSDTFLPMWRDDF
jgi:hypothetical protein